MCGIAGGWWSNPEHAVKRVPLALKKIKHRGPDDDGYQLYPIGGAALALGHTRLSIIDLSSAGHQPMHSRDGRWVIVFNGEVYNYRELRTELQGMGHSFHTDSDTEVLLAAWSEWGVNCLPRLVGMFAFAVFDKTQATLTCVRDAFGIKPFFYSAADGQFAFASELSALLELLPGKPALNWQRSYDYLVHGDYDSTPDTFFSGVHHLPPGHWLQINSANGQLINPQRWWQPRFKELSGWRFEDAVEQVREKFLQNVRLNLRSDVPLGAALSGGIDSSAVVCAMRYLEPDMPLHTFSFIAEGSDVNEEYWVDRVNKFVNGIPHKIRLTQQELIIDIDDMINTQGEPFGSTSIYAQFRLYKSASQNGIKVTLDGQGADEMLAGYSGYPGQRLRSLIETGQISEACKFLSGWSSWPGRSIGQGLRALVGQLAEGNMYNFLRTLKGDKAEPAWLNVNLMREKGVQLKYSDANMLKGERGRRLTAELASSLTTRGLPALLRHGDRNSMRFSIESRVPFLSIELSDLLLSMPESYLISASGETKHVFREAMRGIVPDEVLNRRDKVGFATPEKDWLISSKEIIREWIKEPMGIDCINQSLIIEEFDKVISGRLQFSWQIWRFVNFCHWYNKNYN